MFRSLSWMVRFGSVCLLPVLQHPERTFLVCQVNMFSSTCQTTMVDQRVSLFVALEAMRDVRIGLTGNA